MKKLLLIILLFGCQLFPQGWQLYERTFAPGGVTVQDFSAPVFGDLDGDGDYDLVLGNINLRIDYFENTGTTTNPDFRKDTSMFSSVYAGGYQFSNSDYPALGDLDNDGDLDLVISGYSRMILFWNTGSPSSAVWEKDSAFFGSINPEIGSDARPVFGDLDGDGDLDLIVGAGETLFGSGPDAGVSLGYRNTGTADSAFFVRDDALVAGIPDVGLNAYPSLADIDNDGDLDLFMGRDGAAAHYYKNTGTRNVPAWTRDFTVFNVVETTNYWKDPTFCDLDGDEDFDLIYGTDNGILYHYKNTGTVTSPQYVHVPQSFRVIKADGFSTPSFADIDNDGDLDMLSGSTLGQFFYARNDGDSTLPGFVQASSSFSGIDPGFRSSPVFVDFDSDGDYDIVSGESNSGNLKLYINNNGTFTENTTILSSIHVQYGSMPAFCDIDNDGDLDLLVGSETSGGAKFYLRDTGNVFIEDFTVFAGVSFPSYSSPAFGDIDADGDFDLFIGRSSGALYYYENTGTADSAVWVQNNSFVADIKMKQNSHPALADLDSDGLLDIILGEYDGNFWWYRNPNSVPLGTEEEKILPAEFTLMQNYPNPFNPATVISFTLPEQSYVELKIYDITGREIASLINNELSAGEHKVRFTGKGLSSGVYLYSLKAGNNVITKKMMLVK